MWLLERRDKGSWDTEASTSSQASDQPARGFTNYPPAYAGKIDVRP
jgi:hypothetical protein